MLASIPNEVLRGIRITLVFAVITGLLYPFVITGISQVVFNNQANGSLVTQNGQAVGSSLIGQQFTSNRYFHGRPSETVDANTGKPLPYNAANSGASNLGPSNQALITQAQNNAESYREQNGLDTNQQVPVDAATADFSGLDPNITEANALLQVDRVAASRDLDPAKVRAVVEGHVHGRVLWVFGEPYVNVLEVNMALDSGAAR